jgi:hypothetical protein
MVKLAETDQRLRDTDGYTVESPDGKLGRVEEIWLGPTNEPLALAVRTADGGRALLLGDEVLSVDREYRWVVVGSRPTLLELDAPRLTRGDGVGNDSRIAASWTTTGAVLPAPAARRPPPGLPRWLRRAQPAQQALAERPLWQTIAILYAVIALIVALVIVAAYAVAGAAA